MVENSSTDYKPNSERISRHAAVLSCAAVLALLVQLSAGACLAGGRTERYYDVRIAGNTALASREIRELLPADTADGFVLEDLEAALPSVADRYKRLGYWGAELSLTVDADAGCPQLNIFEGDQVLLSHIGFEGNRVNSDAELSRRLSLRPGMVLTQEQLERDVESLLLLYGTQGYPFARVSPTGFRFADGLAFTLCVDEGEQVRLTGLQIEGNRTTRSGYIAWQIGMQSGVVYSSDFAAEGRSALERTGLFEEVGEFRVMRAGAVGEYHLLVPVTEKRVNQFSGVLGYGSEPRIVSGALDLVLGNIGGSGRRAALHWYRRDHSRSQFRVSYTHPWILGVPAELIARVGHEVDDPTYLLTSFSLGVGSGLRRGLEQAVLFGFERTVYGNSNIIRRDKTTVSLEIGSGGTVADGTAGIPPARLRGEVRLGSVREVRPSGTTTGRSAALHVDGSIVPARWNTWAWRLDFSAGKAYDSEGVIKPDDLFRVGGTRTLRGYREEQFKVESYGLLRAELHYGFSGGASVYPFVNCAAFTSSRYLGETAGWSFKCGYGVGLGVPSRMGFVTVGIGCSQKDPLHQAKMHVAIEKQF